MNLKIDSSKSVYFYNLDGLRFLSAISILLFHKFNNFEWIYYNENPLIYRICGFISRNGLKAVNFFFVLSGYLITYIICNEIYIRGKFNLRNYLVRRVLRIWPLFFIVVILGFFILNNWNRFFLYLLFVNNYDAVYYQQYLNEFLFPLWSIAVEEQFYLIFPIMFYIFKIQDRKSIKNVYIFILIASLGYQVWNYNNINILHYSTISCLTDFVVGGLAAIYCLDSIKFVEYIKKISKLTIINIYILGFIYLLSLVYFTNPLLLSFERAFLALFFVFIIVEQNFAENSFYKMSKFIIISSLGKYTYSLYLFHMFIFTFIHNLFKNRIFLDNWYIDIFGKLILSILLSLGLSFLLYKYIEYPILSFKKKYN